MTVRLRFRSIGHCCACSRVCHHVTPPTFCARHESAVGLEPPSPPRGRSDVGGVNQHEELLRELRDVRHELIELGEAVSDLDERIRAEHERLENLVGRFANQLAFLGELTTRLREAQAPPSLPRFPGDEAV